MYKQLYAEVLNEGNCGYVTKTRNEVVLGGLTAYMTDMTRLVL